MSDTVKVRISLQTNKIGSKEEAIFDTYMSKEEWDEECFEGQSEMVKEIFLDHALTQLGDWDYEEVES